MVAGFLQILMPPASETEWVKMWARPPGPKDIAAQFAPAVARFNVRGNDPAFQDRRITGADLRPLVRLFHAVPDPGRFAISDAAAMVALYAMQAHAYGGGRGYRTSICGGGPLRTVPFAGETLFHQAWALVIPDTDFQHLGNANAQIEKVYPWVGSPDTKDIIEPTTHPASTLLLGNSPPFPATGFDGAWSLPPDQHRG